MKIWKAKLYLYNKNGWKIDFDFETDDKDYMYSCDKTTFIYNDEEGFWVDRIPVNYKYENTLFGGVTLTKGFTNELKGEELEEVKQEMKKVLFDCIQKEKEKVINKYDEKLNCLK